MTTQLYRFRLAWVSLNESVRCPPQKQINVLVQKSNNNTGFNMLTICFTFESNSLHYSNAFYITY